MFRNPDYRVRQHSPAHLELGSLSSIYAVENDFQKKTLSETLLLAIWSEDVWRGNGLAYISIIKSKATNTCHIIIHKQTIQDHACWFSVKPMLVKHAGIGEALATVLGSCSDSCHRWISPVWHCHLPWSINEKKIYKQIFKKYQNISKYFKTYQNVKLYWRYRRMLHMLHIY